MSNKVCGHCKVSKSIDEFSFKSKKLGTRQSVCRECHKTHAQLWYKKNSKHHKKNVSAHRSKYTNRNRLYMIEYLSKHPCVDCGETKIPLLEFDHVKGKKLLEVSKMQGASIQRLQKEIDKCEIRCSNCHKMKTFLQFDYFKDILDRDGNLIMGTNVPRVGESHLQ